MIVLGIDPGLATMGIAAVELLPTGERLIDAYTVTTSASDKKRAVRASEDNWRRMQEIAGYINGALGNYRATLLAAECQSWPRNAGASAKVGMAWGVMAYAAAARNLPLVQATPQEVKKAVCGDKSASKDDVIAAIERRFPEIEWRGPKGSWEHQADAIAVVVACLDSEVVKLARRLAGTEAA